MSDDRREPVRERKHETYEQPHWETAHIERVDNIGVYHAPHEETGEVARIDFDGYGHDGASMHGVDDNVQVSAWLTPEMAEQAFRDLARFVDQETIDDVARRESGE